MFLFSSPLFCDELADLKKKVEKLEENDKKLREMLLKVKKHDAMDNIKFGADFRVTYDYVDYSSSGYHNEYNDILSYRLILTMGAQPTDNLFFKGALAVNKIFGGNRISESTQNFDWFGTVTPDDNILRLREAYFVLSGDLHERIPYSLSIGRRPSLNGLGLNKRDDDEPASPLSHAVNMEFDALSFKIGLEEITEIQGMYLKFCYGRGFSETSGRVLQDPNQAGYFYSAGDDEYTNLDLAGFYLEFFNDSQYRLSSSAFRAFNVPGLKNTSDFNEGFKDIGDIDVFVITGEIDGFGFDSGDFLEDTALFVSFALSNTDPLSEKNETMLGSSKKKTGYSFYTGLTIPVLLTSDGRLGLEYNYGSKYWRSFSYGEDTITGSKVAARGNAYEVYFLQPILESYLTLQARYTYIDYTYSGSEMFFGDTGTPVKIEGSGSVKTSQNVRVAIRYRF